jgi:hypothetical protein
MLEILELDRMNVVNTSTPLFILTITKYNICRRINDYYFTFPNKMVPYKTVTNG